ncbi:MAG: hypothetical protein V3S70_01575 [Gammaproteobacteria bacterium]
MLKEIAIAVCLGLFTGACASQETNVSGETGEPKSVEGHQLKVQPLSVPATSGYAAIPTEMLVAITNDLADELGVPAASIRVLQSQGVIFRDGSLGCPRPGEQYTQALVHGYRVLLTDGKSKYDYRADQQQRFFRCDKPVALPGPGGETPDSRE